MLSIEPATDNEMLQMVSTVVLAAAISYAAGPEFFGFVQNQFWAPALTAATASTTTTFLTKGSLNSKDWRNIAWTALAAGAAGAVHGNNSSIGNWIGDDKFSWIRRAAYHSVVQGGISLLRGDGFAQGAVSGLSSSFAGSAMGSAGLMGQKGFEFKMARGMIAAGFAALASDATGGDAGQAAMTALMVHMFNAEKEDAEVEFEYSKGMEKIQAEIRIQTHYLVKYYHLVSIK